MKRLTKTHIFHIFFALLMFLPFISILSRVIYVQSNKNAKDSYSGNYEITYKYQSNQVNSVDDLVIGNIYEFWLDDEWDYFDENQNCKLAFTPLTTFDVDIAIYLNNEESLQPERYNNMIIEFEYDYIYVYSSAYDYENGDELICYLLNNNMQITTYSFIGILVNYENISFNTMDNVFHYTDYNEIESVNLTGTLDNAFDYSISKFIEDNNFKINFFSWFEDLFLVQNGGVNALYLSFANWYMCYALLVSTGYLLFLILMWFINYVRKILEGGNSFGHGGF